MNTITLPQDLIHTELHDVCFYRHSSKGTQFNHSVNFRYHVINFLIEGTKGIISPEKKETIDQDFVILIRSGNCLMTETTSSNGNYSSYLLFFNDNAINDFKNRFDVASSSLKSKSLLSVCSLACPEYSDVSKNSEIYW